ncbi:MAG: META domain-containing protein [Methanoregulaceae archaeon]|nr:MAG: META domain-containing protein [Methanoregulaceae archaeon]
MAGDAPADQDKAFGNDTDKAPSGPPEKMGPAFYASLALIGCLVLMVVFLNYPAARANAGAMLTQTNWTLQSCRDSTGILVPAQTGTDVTAKFEGDGRVSGQAGCNGYSAAYTTSDYSISITGIGSTKMLCHGPGSMDQESAFLSDLSMAASFRVSESTLKFYDANGKTVLVFVPA